MACVVEGSIAGSKLTERFSNRYFENRILLAIGKRVVKHFSSISRRRRRMSAEFTGRAMEGAK
ncbi:hypothetical protein DESC_580102 [Desulfosarcina cetonica]|nr:hypothetical protein DESC_580102 [Desulfosarcina cetonica]